MVAVRDSSIGPRLQAVLLSRLEGMQQNLCEDTINLLQFCQAHRAIRVQRLQRERHADPLVRLAQGELSGGGAAFEVGLY